MTLGSGLLLPLSYRTTQTSQVSKTLFHLGFPIFLMLFSRFTGFFFVCFVFNPIYFLVQTNLPRSQLFVECYHNFSLVLAISQVWMTLSLNILTLICLFMSRLKFFELLPKRVLYRQLKSQYFISFFFLLCCMACGILIPRPGTEPGHWQWKCRVLTTGPLGKSQIFSF